MLQTWFSCDTLINPGRCLVNSTTNCTINIASSVKCANLANFPLKSSNPSSIQGCLYHGFFKIIKKNY